MHWRKQSKAREDQLQVESRLTDHPEQRGQRQRARDEPLQDGIPPGGMPTPVLVPADTPSASLKEE